MGEKEGAKARSQNCKNLFLVSGNYLQSFVSTEIRLQDKQIVLQEILYLSSGEMCAQSGTDQKESNYVVTLK